MAFSKIRKFGLVAAGVLGSLAIASAADASVTITGVAFDTPGAIAGTLTYTPPRPDYVVRTDIGRLALTTSTGDTLLSYCIDIFHGLTTGTFDAAAITTTSLTATQISQLSALLSNGEALVTDANHSAAEQLAIWEIVTEGSNRLNVSSGDFSVSNVNRSAVTLANSYLANVNNGTWIADPSLSLAVLKDSNNQTQLVWGATADRVMGAVPEPATWAMMLVGFGAIGGTLRRKKPAGQTVAIFG
ncbi:PEP-CTERM sorting domain-containing protein [Sphingomonas sp. AP4-R1]|uniref:PEPxxWA-CTERM sorting domain-containing protein n=1 Tax=Sphingomonas sp. AP4-R1 TaxID=2735134 RepID=UPI0014939D23|nr:PEPxxWA-CTERM sorting domain-containing protein [Sphingomonas sp. AP4-R1]QJU56619.1 PEP-CTERM sorting domain-containing protein [Sphingomonas sp. AP4-R1]